MKKQFVAEKGRVNVVFDPETNTVELFQKVDGRWLTVALTPEELKSWSDKVAKLAKGAQI